MSKKGIGTLRCKLFGHKMYGQRVVYDPHYLNMVEQGIATFRTSYDLHREGFPTDYCVRCGIKREEI